MVNSGMLAFYWSIGRDIASLQFENNYGSKFYSTLSRDLFDSIPRAGVALWQHGEHNAPSTVSSEFKSD